ncbi:MAG: hypothetical protein IJ419_14700 [Agathobacter sp.]|nr:hypothetical protein [Agathobacter sp.]
MKNSCYACNCCNGCDENGCTLTNMDGVLIVNDYTLEKVIIYDVEKDGKEYRIYMIAFPDSGKILFQSWISRVDDIKSCFYKTLIQTPEDAKCNKKNIEYWSSAIINGYAHDMIESYETLFGDTEKK